MLSEPDIHSHAVEPILIERHRLHYHIVQVRGLQTRVWQPSESRKFVNHGFEPGDFACDGRGAFLHQFRDTLMLTRIAPILPGRSSTVLTVCAALEIPGYSFG